MKATRTCKTHIFKIRCFVLAAALSAGQGFVTPAFATRAYIVDLNSYEAIALGSLGGGEAYATDINDAGRVVGTSTSAGFVYYAFITGPDGADMASLGVRGTGLGINAAGQAVGEFDTSGGGFRGFMTGPNGAGLSPLAGNTISASDINDVGRVVGAHTIRGEIHAFITGPNGMGITDLGTLGENYSVARGINDAGQVVGAFITDGGEYHAFVTGPNGVGMTDLTSLVSLPDGAPLTSAQSINNSGQVLVLSPVPEPGTYAMLLAGLGLLGLMRHRRKCV